MKKRWGRGCKNEKKSIGSLVRTGVSYKSEKGREQKKRKNRNQSKKEA